MCKKKFPYGYFFNFAGKHPQFDNQTTTIYFFLIFALFKIILIYTYIYIEEKKNIIR